MILAVKEDIFGHDAISLSIELVGKDEPLFIRPETEGYHWIMRSLHERLPGIDPDWYKTMMRDSPSCCERVLYERD